MRVNVFLHHGQFGHCPHYLLLKSWGHVRSLTLSVNQVTKITAMEQIVTPGVWRSNTDDPLLIKPCNQIETCFDIQWIFSGVTS